MSQTAAPRRSRMRSAGIALAIMGAGGGAAYGIDAMTRPAPVSQACVDARRSQVPDAEEICRQTTAAAARAGSTGGSSGGPRGWSSWSRSSGSSAPSTSSVSRGGFGSSGFGFSSSS